MPLYNVRTPDGRMVKVESPDVNTAARDAEAWAKANPPQTKPEKKPSWEQSPLDNPALNALASFGEGLGQNLAGAGNSLLRWNDRVDRSGGIYSRLHPLSMLKRALLGSEAGQQVRDWFDEGRDLDLGYRPSQQALAVQSEPVRAFMSDPLGAIGGAYETGIAGLGPTAVAMANPYVAGLGLWDQLSYQRAENNNRDKPLLSDDLLALPGAAASTALDRLGGRAMFGLGDDVLGMGKGAILKAMGKAAAKEAATEGVQNPIEYATSTLGTERGDFTLGGLGNAALSGAVVGGLTGGALRGGTATAQSALRGDFTPPSKDRTAQIRLDLAEQFAEEQAGVRAAQGRMVGDQIADTYEQSTERLALPAPQPTPPTPGLDQATIDRASAVDRRAEVEPILVNMANAERQEILRERAERDPITPFRSEPGYRYDQVRDFGPATNRIIEEEEFGPEGVWVRAPESAVAAWEKSPVWEGVLGPVIKGLEYHSRTGWRPLRELVGERPSIPDEAKADPNLVAEPEPYSPETYANVVGFAMEKGVVRPEDFAGVPGAQEAMEAAHRRGDLRHPTDRTAYFPEEKAKGPMEGAFTPSEQTGFASKATPTPARQPTGDELQPDFVGPPRYEIKPLPAADSRDRVAFDEDREQTKPARIKLMAKRGGLERKLIMIPQDKPTDPKHIRDYRAKQRANLREQITQLEDQIAGLKMRPDPKTGRPTPTLTDPAFAVVERRGPKEVARHTFPTRKAAEDFIKGKHESSIRPPRTTRAQKRAKMVGAVYDRVKPRLERVLGPDRVQLVVRDIINDLDDDSVVKGFFDPNGKVIQLAAGVYEGKNFEERLSKVLEVLDHEIIHAARASGVITDSTMRSLTKEAKRVRYVHNGETRDYTLFERSQEMNKGAPDWVAEEEAVAELFRQQGVDPKPRYRGILNKLIAWLREIFRAHSTAQRYMQKLREGGYAQAGGDIDPDLQRMYSQSKKIVEHLQSQPKFQRWFRNSKVVEEDGSPKVVFHGTKKEWLDEPDDWKGEKGFEYFRVGREMGAHFGTFLQANDRIGMVKYVSDPYATDDLGKTPWAHIQDFSDHFGGGSESHPTFKYDKHMYPAVLSIQNPVRVKDRGSFWSNDVAYDLLDKDIISPQEYSAIATEDETIFAGRLKALLMEKGYDGIVYLNRGEAIKPHYNYDKLIKEINAPLGSGDKTDDQFKLLYPQAEDSYIAFYPQQIKSVFNSGEFGVNDPRIMYSRTENPDIFGSNLLKALDNTTTKKASPEQWKATLIKAPGVKKDELEWSGVLDWLDAIAKGEDPYGRSEYIEGNPKAIEKWEVEDWIKSEGPEIAEIVLTDDNSGYMDGSDSEPGYYDEDENWVSYSNDTNDTQYSSYKQPGGENYREFLFRLPVKGRLHSNDKTFDASHWNDSNVIFHVRTTDRVDAEGKRVLFLEEVQSDWHQRGREQGYSKGVSEEEIREKRLVFNKAQRDYEELLLTMLPYAHAHYVRRAREVDDEINNINMDAAHAEYKLQQLQNTASSLEKILLKLELSQQYNREDQLQQLATWGVNMERGAFGPLSSMPKDEAPPAGRVERIAQARLARTEALNDLDAAMDGGIPDAPFKKSWDALAMKRMIQIAAKEGFDKIAWIKGGQENGGGYGDKSAWFYERNLPNIVNDIVKRYGARVENVGISELAGGVNLSARSMDLHDEAIRLNKEIQRVADAIVARDARGGAERTRQRIAMLRDPNNPDHDPANVELYEARAQVLESALPLYDEYEGLVKRVQEAEAASRASKAEDEARHRQDPQNLNPGITITPELKAAALNPTSSIRMYSRSRAPKDYDAIRMAGLRPSPASPHTISGDGGTERMQARQTIVVDTLSKFIPFLSRERQIQIGDRVAAELQDKFQPINRLVTNYRQQGMSIPDAQDAALEVSLFPNASAYLVKAKYESIYRDAMRAVAQIKGAKSLMNRLQSVSRIAKGMDAENMTDGHKAAYLLAYAQHAAERNAFIRDVRGRTNDDGSPMEDGSGMSNEEAQRIIDTIMGSPQQAAVMRAASAWRAIAKDTVLTRIREGTAPDWAGVRKRAIDAAEAAKEELKRTDLEPAERKVLEKTLAQQSRIARLIPNYEYYVPLRGRTDIIGDPDEGIDDDIGPGVQEGANMRTGMGFKIAGREDQLAKGRQSVAGDIFTALVQQNMEATVRGVKNRVAQAFVNMIYEAEKQGMPLTWAEPAKGSARRFTVGSDGRVRTSRVNSNDPNDTLFVAKFGGHEVGVLIKDRALAEAMLGLHQRSESELGRWLNWATQLQRFMGKAFTAWNPDFSVRNVVRDYETAVAQLIHYSPKAAARLAGGQPKTLGLLIARDKATLADLKRLQELGGIPSYFGLDDALGNMEKVKNHIEEERRKLGEKTNEGALRTGFRLTKKGFGMVTDGLEAAAQLGESATRLAIFRALKQEGWSEKRAAQAALEVTTAFSRRGRASTLMGALYLFYNANMQGSAGFLKAAFSKGGAAAISTVMILGVMQELMLGDDDEYENIPEDIKERNWVLGLPGMEKIIIPMPWGFNVAHSMGRHTIRALKGKEGLDEAALTITGQFLGAFNPIGSQKSNTVEGAIWKTLTPSVFRPMTELAINEDWTGSRIHPEQSFGVPKVASQNITPYAPTWARSITDTLHNMGGVGSYSPGFAEINPHDLDHLFSAYLGGFGKTIARLSELGIWATNPDAQRAKGKDFDMAQVPIARAFIPPVASLNVSKSYYESVERYLQISRGLKEQYEQGTADSLDDFMRRHGEEIALAEEVAVYERERIKLARQRREIQDMDMPDEDKAAIVKSISEQEQAIMKASLQRIRLGT